MTKCHNNDPHLINTVSDTMTRVQQTAQHKVLISHAQAQNVTLAKQMSNSEDPFNVEQPHEDQHRLVLGCSHSAMTSQMLVQHWGEKNLSSHGHFHSRRDILIEHPAKIIVRDLWAPKI
jgi:hypothetical protein